MAASARKRITITPIQQSQIDTHRDILQAITLAIVVAMLAVGVGYQLTEWNHAMEIART